MQQKKTLKKNNWQVEKLISGKDKMFSWIIWSASWLRKKWNKDSHKVVCRNFVEELPTCTRTLMPRDKNMFIQVYRIQPCCTAACICPQTHHSLTHTCAPRRLQPLLIVCSCFAEKPDWLAVSSLAVVTSNPDAGLGHLPPGGWLLFNDASARVMHLISLALKAKLPSPKARGTLSCSQMSGLKSHPPFLNPDSGVFLLVSHTRRRGSWHMLLAKKKKKAWKHVYQVDRVQGLF